MALPRAADLGGKALHQSLVGLCPHCGGTFEASSFVKAYQALAARRYRKRHPKRGAEASRRWRARQQEQGQEAALECQQP